MNPASNGNLPERSLPRVFELACADAHPLGCVEVMESEDREKLVALAREHGEFAHGFTPVWYSADRLAAMARAVQAR